MMIRIVLKKYFISSNLSTHRFLPEVASQGQKKAKSFNQKNSLKLG